MQKEKQHLAPRYRVFLFGPMRLEHDEAESTTSEPSYTPYIPNCWDRQSPWRVLAYLLTRVGRQTYKDPLLDALWPDEGLEHSQQALSIALSHVRNGLLDYQGQSLMTPRRVHEQKIIRLAGQEHIWCDWHAFTDALTQAQLAEQHSGDALALWEKAYALSQEEFLLTERYHDWCRRLRERAEEDQRVCILHLAACYGMHGRKADEERLLRQFLNEHPHDEEILYHLSALLVQQGRAQEASRWYRRTIETLEEEEIEMTEQTREVGQQLQKLPQTAMLPFPTNNPRDIIQERVSPQPLPPESSALTSVFDRATQFTVTIFGLVNQWQGRAAHCNDLQVLLSQEFAMFEQDALQPNAENQNALSRRQALVAIAALPYGALAAARHAGTELQPEAFLPQSTAAITSCWSMMQGREFGVVEQALSHCLPALATLAQQSSPYQQTAAGLAAQSHFLLSHLAMHKLRFKDRVTHCKQAVEYGHVAKDRSLQVSALCTLADAYFQVDNLQSQLQTYQQAAQMLDGLPLVLQSKVLGGLAHAYAQQKQAQEVARYVDKARIVLTPKAHQQQLPLYLAMDYGPVQAMQYEGQAWLDLGERLSDSMYYQKAADAFQSVEQLPDSLVVSERIHVEIVNQRALVAIRSGNFDLFRTLLIQGAEGAHALASEKRRREVVTNWREARKVWPREPQITELADLLVE